MAQQQSLPLNGPSAVALGYFDGLHLGHRAVIRAALSHCAEGLVPSVFTFCTDGASPRKKQGAAALSSEEEKLALLADAGILRVENPDFSTFQGMSPEEFVRDFLVGRMKAKLLCCGADFRFGKGACAGVEELRALAAPLGAELCVVPAVIRHGSPVSSTRIRQAIAEGNMQLAADLLGRRYSFAEPVVEGKRLGRRLGFPTLNQRLPAGRSLPPAAVYAAWVQTPDGVWRKGVCNIGSQPTVEGCEPLAETFILDYSGDLYGCTVRLAPWQKLREIRRFDSVEQLRQAVLENAAQAEAILSEAPPADHMGILPETRG